MGHQDKMPLINKTKSILTELQSLVKDEADANVVMFYLKKGFKNVRGIVDGRKDVSANKGLNVSEYFANRENTLQTHTMYDANSHNTKSACSIAQNLPNSEVSLGWIKENYSTTNCENLD